MWKNMPVSLVFPGCSHSFRPRLSLIVFSKGMFPEVSLSRISSTGSLKESLRYMYLQCSKTMWPMSMWMVKR